VIITATKYNFYIVSDHINSKAKDIERMNKFASAFKYLGHKAKVCERGTDAHSNPNKYGCTGKNDVWVCVFGGVDIEVISDHTGYKQSDWFKDRIKKANLMYIYMSSPEGQAVSLNGKVGTAHDGKGNISGLSSISNVADFLKKHNITYIRDGTTDAVVQKIRQGKFEGANFLSSSVGDTSTTSYTIKHGFDTSQPFEAYLRVDYTIDMLDGKGKIDKKAYIDFTSQSQEVGVYSFNNDPLVYQNLKKFANTIPLLEHLKEIHDPSRSKSYKYYLKKVSLIRHFDKKTNNGVLWDKKTDDASYKINLYRMGLSTGEATNPMNLGVSGKSLMDSVKTILEKAKYHHKIIYAKYRDNDRINFVAELEMNNPVHTFNEGIDGDVIGVSNVKYSPTSDLINNSITTFKSIIKENNTSKTMYRYARKGKLTQIMRYGEQTHLESLSETSAFAEASQVSYNNLQDHYRPNTTFTVRASGLANVDVNDFVATEMINPLLSNQFIVQSRKIITDVTKRPMIQTEYGLGDIDRSIKVKKDLAKQRKALRDKDIDVEKSCHYVDNMSDNFIDYADENDIDYNHYEVWVDE